MVFRLMSHQMFRSDEQWRSLDCVHEWKECPIYIQNLLNRNCCSVKGIGYFANPFKGIGWLSVEGNEVAWNKHFVFDQFFKTHNGWVHFDRLISVFPNLQLFGFHLDDANTIQYELESLLL